MNTMGNLNGSDLRAAADMRKMQEAALSAQEREQSLQVRVTALQLAVSVAGSSGNAEHVLDAAAKFLAFVSAAPKGSH